MKKILSFAVLVALTANVADAAPSYLERAKDGSYKVTYDYTDRAEVGRWYIGGHLGLNLMSWENKYESNDPGVDGAYDSDKYSMESVFSGSVFAGRTFNYFLRAELEAGVIGSFDDQDDGFAFKLTTPYLMANGYYDFANGMYVGAGLGIAVPKTELDGEVFVSGDRTEYGVSPMVGLMVGYSHKLDYNLILDLRYRLAGFVGTDHERVLDGVDAYTFKNEIGLILDNSLSVGIRYEF